MKKMLVLLAAVALASVSASAQTTTETSTPQASYPGRRGQGHPQMAPEQRAQRMTARLTSELSLSTSQVAQVQGILLAQAQANDAIRTKYAASTDRRAAMPEIKALKEKYDTQLTDVLTAEQRTKYAQLRDKQQQRKEKIKDGKVKAKAQS